MNLFDYMRENNMEKESPLAARLRPVTLEEVVGQKHIIGKDIVPLRRIRSVRCFFTGRREREKPHWQR